MGDVAAAGQGAVQMIVGAAGDIGGTLLDLTGVGAAIGVPAQVASTAIGLDGVGVAGTAASNLITQAKALPSGLVGTQDDESGPVGNRHVSGPLDPAHGGTGDPAKDFDTLTGGKSGPAPDGSRYPAGTQVGDNGIASRPAKGASGPRIDIPANGDKPHETLHYPKEQQ